jgi:6,7-dimethyl-8-ribityllumazine synthase
MDASTPSDIDAGGLRIGLAVSAYHADVTGPMRDAAVRAFLAAGGAEKDLREIEAPGAFELTAVCRALAARGDLDAVAAIGCIISGETAHDRYLASAVATGLTMITVQTGTPIAFGVLTCQTPEQARARSTGPRGKGAEAMRAAIAACRAVRLAAERR